MCLVVLFFFFFQAEDGIRDFHVTGVQTCALPISPSRKLSNSTPRELRWRGRGCTRTHAGVITPRVPSEPASMRSGLGPAPEPGRRRDSHRPVGVRALTDSTKSSMWVHTVAKWPPARVAIQPPRVEYSNDWGK